MKLTDQEYEYWVRFANTRSLISFPNGSTFKPSECSEYADRMIEELRKRGLLDSNRDQ